MTGICGLISDRRDGLDECVTAMLETMRFEPWHVVEAGDVVDGRAALGRISLGFVNAAPQPVSLSDAPLCAVMDGELYDASEQRSALEALGQRFEGESDAEILARGYLERGRDFVRGLNGKFSAALWDGRSDRLVLVNDHFGMRPLYYAVGGDGAFLFSSQMKALLADEAVSDERNPLGVVQFFTFGQLYGNETLYASIRALPAAAWIEFDARSGRVAVDCYARQRPPAIEATRREHLERIDAAFTKAVSSRLRTENHYGLSLSGGLDARTILAVIDHSRTKIDALCMGVEGSGDQRSSKEMARIVGCGYRDFILDEKFLGNFREHLDRMVTLTDGQYLSQCIILPTLHAYRDLGVEVLLRGHAGELMHMRKAYNFSLDGAAQRIATNAQLEDWLFNHLRAFMLDNLDEPLLAFADAAECDALARQSIQTALTNTDDWERPLDRIWGMFLSERSRRETAMSMVKFGSVVETRLPYLDRELVDALLAAPADLKTGEEIQEFILRRHCPEFLNVTNVNTGARVGAGPIMRRLQTFKMKVFGKLGVRGYQPYEKLGLWIRHELRDLVCEVLLDARCLERGVFRPDTVRTVVDQHMSSARNHTYLIIAMLIFEWGQRRFADHARDPQTLIETV